MRKGTGYKKTGVFAVDLVTACVNHYEKSATPVERIILHPEHYKAFCEYVSKTMPDYVIEDCVELDDVRITCGIDVMTESMYYYFKKPLTVA
jgi:hypothetical protein